MNWSELLKGEMTAAYHAADGLMALVDDSMLGWKPATGQNWMTVGQLLKHVPEACGWCCKGFVTGDWGTLGESDDDMLPPAEKMASVASVAEARKALAADKRTALSMIKKAGERALATKKLAAPWNPKHKELLGLHFLHMVGHLNTHKAQLFYYLKLMGKTVHTGNLYGM